MHLVLVNGDGPDAKETANTVDMVHEAFVERIAPVVFIASMIKLILAFICFAVVGLLVDAGGRILTIYLPGNEESVCWWTFRLHAICMAGIVAIGGLSSFKLIKTLRQVLEYETKAESLMKASKDKNQGIKDLLK